MPSTVDNLVNRMMMNWEKQKEAADRAGRKDIRQKPVITISREYGGGRGLVIGQLVAKSLEFEFFERKLVEKIAASAKVRERIVESLDDRRMNAITEYLTTQFETGGFTSSDYLQHLSKVLLAVGQHGRAVIVGRGAHFILSPERTLRVRLIAPLETRVQQIASDHDLTLKEARAQVLQMDAEREAFGRQHFNKDVTDSGNYDLVLNYAAFTAEVAAELVVKAFKGRFAL
jgi:cytidylate kinase